MVYKLSADFTIIVVYLYSFYKPNLISTIVDDMLYIVPTPIGNLDDITLRAIRVLQTTDIIACEDTRHSGLLLKALNIDNNGRLQSYHDYNEEEKSNVLISMMLEGKSVALISDAGTPCISDPGYRLVNKAIANGIKVTSLPGASAAITGLVASGLPVHSFTFVGFPPQKKGRHTFIKQTLENTYTTIFYESSHRISKLIAEIAEISPNRNVCICREISKLYEEYIRFNTSNIQQIKIVEKGEFIVIVEGKEYL